MLFLLLLILIAAPRPAAAQNVPASILGEVRSLKYVPVGQYALRASWSAAGVGEGHQTGGAESDAQAAGGTAWVAASGEATPGREMVYGPYRRTAAGDYVAFVRLKSGSDAGAEVVATLDACTGHGQNILASREVRGRELAPGHYVQAALAFHCPGGALEVRINWRGYTDLAVDKITLFKLTGGNVSQALPMAAPAQLSGVPNGIVPDQEARPFPDLFPRSAPPAHHLLVVDLEKMPPDRQLLFLSLEGLVNRSQPRIYCIFQPSDRMWLAWMVKRGWIQGYERVNHPSSLLGRFRGRFFHALVITDPELPATINTATMLAAVKGWLIASPRIAKSLNLPVGMDLRGKWHTTVEACLWSFQHLWPQLTHHVIACAWPDHIGLRDYLVEKSIFCFWISGPIDGAEPFSDPTAEARLMEQLLARMPADIPVMSYPWAGKDVGIGEGPGVKLLAEFGKYLVGSIDCTNLSVHSGIRVRIHRPAPPPAPKLDAGKVYASWIISDGDNLPVLTNNNFPQLWAEKQRGTIPLGWTMSPSAAVLIPDIVDYYTETATPDDAFLAAVSGAGYTYPDFFGDRFRAPYRQRVWNEFLHQTAAEMSLMGERSIWVMNATQHWEYNAYARAIPGIQAIFPDYGRQVAGYSAADFPVAGLTPVFRALTQVQDGLSEPAQVASLVSQIRQFTPKQRPAFMHLFAMNWDTTLPMLKEVMDRLGPGYVCVRPGQLAALYREQLKRAKVLVRAAHMALALPGRRIHLSVTVQNVTDRPLELRLLAAGGMSSVAIRPDRAALASGQALHCDVSGFATGPKLLLRAVSGSELWDKSVEVLNLKAREVVGNLPRGMRFVQSFDASSLAHEEGAPVADATALSANAWQIVGGMPAGKHALYGPYASEPPGTYTALYRLKRTGKCDAASTVARLDPCVGGGLTVEADTPITAEQLPRGKWRWVSVEFRHAGGQLETRLVWTGSAALEADVVGLWRAP
ncbi:MAG: hypothetical protein KGJ62_08530 [Armatimonadetes bacterium]|nr:hypothetical protein [Armatimonadota bacterium]MDE2205062.1 hypothetical protein [Armatimonadota bacterium]